MRCEDSWRFLWQNPFTQIEIDKGTEIHPQAVVQGLLQGRGCWNGGGADKNPSPAWTTPWTTTLMTIALRSTPPWPTLPDSACHTKDILTPWAQIATDLATDDAHLSRLGGHILVKILGVVAWAQWRKRKPRKRDWGLQSSDLAIWIMASRWSHRENPENIQCKLFKPPPWVKKTLFSSELIYTHTHIL